MSSFIFKNRLRRIGLISFAVAIVAGGALGEVFWKKPQSPKIPSSLTAVAHGKFLYNRMHLHGIPLEMEGVSVNLPFSEAFQRGSEGMRVIESTNDRAAAVGSANGYATALLAFRAGMNTFLFRVSGLEKDLQNAFMGESAWALDDPRFSFECRVFAGEKTARSWLAEYGARMKNGHISGNGFTGTYADLDGQIVMVFCRD